MSPVMDTACNMRLDNWSSFSCHGNLDEVLTPTGDTAVISGEWALLKQHIIFWVATPLGEDIDPKCGCILHKYEFGKATNANYKKIELELRANLQYNFPEYTITNVRAVPGDTIQICRVVEGGGGMVEQNSGPIVPECLAFGKCKTDCSICISLPENDWKKHVHKVLRRK